MTVADNRALSALSCTSIEAAVEDRAPQGRVVLALEEGDPESEVERGDYAARRPGSAFSLQRPGRLRHGSRLRGGQQRAIEPAGRLFDLEIAAGRFTYHYNDHALAYEELLAGRYVLTTSLAPTQAGTAQVVASYRQLANIEARFRTLKDFLHLRPVRHWTEQRVRGHVAVCVYAAVIETLIGL